MGWDRPSKQAVAAADAEREAAEIDAHNARCLRDELESHLRDVQYSLNQARGSLDDLAVYFPKDDAA